LNTVFKLTSKLLFEFTSERLNGVLLAGHPLLLLRILVP